MPNIYELDVSAANNASTGGQNWAEGQAAGTVNNSARQLNALIAQFLADIGGDLEAGGTANALTLTANSDFTAYADGRIIAFKASADNTAATTLSVNGIGAKAIRKMTSAGEAAIDAGDIINGYTYVVRYSETANSAAGAWLLDWAPKADTSAFVTLTGTQTLTNKTITLTDAALTITGSSDATKKLNFQIDGFTTATTRTVTVPDSDLTLIPDTRTITASTGLTGGGDLSANRSLAVDSTVWRDGDTPSASQINGIIAGASVGQVGTYAFLRYAGVANPGDNVSGVNLAYAHAGGTTGGGSPSGVWQCMGRTAGASDESSTTLWLRIS